MIDVGSGAGLPGLVWAIARPDLTVTLLEPLERRVRFLEVAVVELDVDNATVLRGRAQDVSVTADRVAARAVSATKNLLPWLSPLVSQGGHMVLMKGQRAEEEIAAAAGWMKRHAWRADIRDVGTPPRTRVVDVQRVVKG